MRATRCLSAAKAAIVTVGGGRGFLVQMESDVIVITAAHCLPHLPPAHPASYTEERTYAALLGPLGAKPTVWAQCLFVDPIADLAILSEPDNQVLFDESDAYLAFVADRPTLQLGRPGRSCTVWLLSRDGARWERGRAEVRDSNAPWLDIVGADKDAIASGTSGSPILSDDGRAVGVVSVGPSMNPVLANDLPARWLAHLLTGEGGA